MRDLRAPDPTLSDLAGDATLVDESLTPPLAHRAGDTLACDRDSTGMHLLSATYARWFAVPCRECFPDAPEPGGGRDCIRPDCNVDHAKYLAWQVREAADAY